MFRQRASFAGADDATLVMQSLGGDRDAFCEIVVRYQTLLCSLAYSAIGDIKQSEDIAQEAFIDAWRKLDTLRDPVKLKSWLCGILRFKVSHHRRKEESNPDKMGQELNEVLIQDQQQGELDEHAIQHQQEALMWQTLDKMDETYREPLILFYREQQSVEKVAEELDLSVDTAKQRLSRGRKLLKRAMSSFVEDTLKNSKPGVAFTAAVITAIQSIAPPAKAAAMGAGAAKASSAFNATTLLALLGTFSGLISAFFGLRASLDQSRTQSERRLVIKVVSVFVLVAFIFVAGMLMLKWFAAEHADSSMGLAFLSQLWVGGFIVVYAWLTFAAFNAMKTLRAHERLFDPAAFTDSAAQKDATQKEYLSRLKLLGVPLVHFQFGMPEKDEQPAFAWIAGGSSARGLLFAWGGVALAPISVGIISVGIVTVGAVGLGIFSMGTVAIGLVAFGASAIGYKAYASLSSLGWESAFSNGFSMAVEAAIGPVAIADHVNNESASQLVQLASFAQHYHWALAVIALLVIVPAAWHAHAVRKRMRP